MVVGFLTKPVSAKLELLGRGLRKFFTNLRVRSFDKAHATKRVLSRAWPSDTYLKGIVDELVLGPDALVQQIRWSPIFRARFQDTVNKLTNGACQRIKDLAAAKHRFTSLNLPLRRAAVFLVPLIRTIQLIADSRPGPEGQAARDWLRTVTEEKCLQLALLADVSEETIQLNRFFDQDCFDRSAIGLQLQKFLQKLTWLIERRGALETGCTQMMCHTLRAPKTIHLPQQVVRTLGGPGHPQRQALDRVFQRMSNWLQLCRLSIKADFPEFETMQLCTAFCLDTEPDLSKLRNFANLLQLPGGQLVQEFEDLRPAAVWHFRNGAQDSEHAWVLAWRDCTDMQKKRLMHLSSVLARVLAWNPSTSGLERLFSKAKCSTSMNRSDVSEVRLDDEVMLLSLWQKQRQRKTAPAKALPRLEKVLKEAQAVWCQTWGPPRERQPGLPCQQGRKRAAATQWSEAAFVRRRTEEVAKRSQEVDAATVSEPAERVVGQDGWLQSQENERKHLELKRECRRMRAIQEGALQPADDREAAVYAAWIAHQNRLDADALKKTGAVFARPAPPALANQQVWFDEGAVLALPEGDRHRLARRWGMTVSESSLQATVHVWIGVSRPSRAGVCWQAALAGKFVMDPEFFTSLGRAGSSLCFLGATLTSRIVHVHSCICGRRSGFDS